jgi:mannose-6-phosphate isomerase-like protein (cupin superfamily)
MEHVRTDAVESWMSPASAKRPLSNALGAEDVSINHYELAPGESFAFGYHRHEGQEEVFCVLEGTATFETGPPAEAPERVEVSAGEAIRFAAGEWQQGTNESDERVVALAIGAPASMGETTILRECGDCGERTEQEIEPTETGDALLTRCLDCGTETGRFD